MKTATLTGLVTALTAGVAIAQPKTIVHPPVQATSAKKVAPPDVEPTTKERERLPPRRQVKDTEPTPPRVASPRIDSALAAVIQAWPEQSRNMVITMCGKYGLPKEYTAGIVMWREVGPWKRVVVHRDPITHGFPTPHQDVLEQVIGFDVPVDKIDDVAALDGSLSAHRTRGELAVEGESEATNILALNLAHAVIADQQTPAEARVVMQQSATAYLRGHKSPLTEQLRFVLPERHGDPDQPTVKISQR